MNNYSLTDRGKERAVNQDYYSNYFSNCFSLFIVADGMGGHRAGEIASHVAADTAREFVIERKSREDYSELIREAFEAANQRVYREGRENPDYEGMGTTLVIALLANEKLTIGHVGDSRIYRLRNGNLERLTRDHSLVEDLVSRGLLTQEDARTFPERNIVTRAIGIFEEVEADIAELTAEDGDKYLLCSDGLTNMVTDDRIKALLSEDIPVSSICEHLVAEANDNGGLDNITATVFEYRS